MTTAAMAASDRKMRSLCLPEFLVKRPGEIFRPPKTMTESRSLKDSRTATPEQRKAEPRRRSSVSHAQSSEIQRPQMGRAKGGQLAARRRPPPPSCTTPDRRPDAAAPVAQHLESCRQQGRLVVSVEKREMGREKPGKEDAMTGTTLKEGIGKRRCFYQLSHWWNGTRSGFHGGRRQRRIARDGDGGHLTKVGADILPARRRQCGDGNHTTRGAARAARQQVTSWRSVFRGTGRMYSLTDRGLMIRHEPPSRVLAQIPAIDTPTPGYRPGARIDHHAWMRAARHAGRTPIHCRRREVPQRLAQRP